MTVHPAPRGPSRADRFLRWTAVLLGAVLASIGCSPLSMIAFFCTPDYQVPAACPLGNKDKDCRIAVVVDFEVMPESRALVQTDRDIADRLTKVLTERYKDKTPKVTFLAQHQVKAQQNRHANTWRNMVPLERGKVLKVDYVISLDIHSMSLFKEKSLGSLYEGRAEISVAMTDVSQPDGEGTKFEHLIQCQYPKERPMGTSEMSELQFRSKFVDRIVRDTSRLFAAHEQRDHDDFD